MAKTRETSTDKEYTSNGAGFVDDKKPNWVNHAHLDAPMEDSLANRLIYKPALRFHGLTGGLWGASALSDVHSIPSDRPPSYKMVESMKSRSNGDIYSDIDTIYKSGNISAISPLTLRKRNTMAVVLVAIALLAAAATITGVSLHFLNPKGLLRANVRFTIANRNFSDEMVNSTSVDFHAIEQPLCEEMDDFFLTSELADFYLGCKVVSLRHDDTRVKNGTAVHFNLDFIENSVSNDGDRIKKIIMRRSGRHKTDDTLYLVIRDFLVYLRSLRVDLEVLSLPDNHPGRTPRVRIPWNRDIDFISSKSQTTNKYIVNEHLLTGTNHLTDNVIGAHTLTIKDIRSSEIDVPKLVLPGGDIRNANIITPRSFHFDATQLLNEHAMYLSKIVTEKSVLFGKNQNVFVLPFVNVFNKETLNVGEGFLLTPTKYFSERSDENNFNNIPIVRTADDVTYFKPHSINSAEYLQPQPTIYHVQKNNPKTGRRVQNNVISWEIDEEKLDAMTFAPVHTHLQTSFDDISANEAGINNIATEALFTQTNELNTSPVLNPDSFSSKVMTLSSDMFLIHGSKSYNDETVKDSVKRNTNIDVRYASINYIPILNEMEERYVDVTRASMKSNVFKPSVIVTPIKLFEPTVSVLNALYLTSSETGLKDTLPLSLAKRNDYTDQEVVKADDVMQMNEFIDAQPEQKPVQQDHENVEWINIFNEPQITTIQHVGSLPKHNSPANQQNGHVVVTKLDSDLDTLSSERQWINMFNIPKITTLQFVGNLRNKIQTNHKSKNSNIDRGNNVDQNRKDNKVIVVVRDNTLQPAKNDLIPLNNANNYSAQGNNPRQKQHFRSTTNNRHYVPKDSIRRTSLAEERVTNLQSNMHNNVFTLDKTVVVQNRDIGNSGSKALIPTKNRSVPNNIPNFQLIRRVIDGRHVLVLRKADSGDNFVLGVPDALDRQTWMFLQNIGMNFTTSSVPLDNENTPTMNKLFHGNVDHNAVSQSSRQSRLNTVRAARRTRNDRPNPRQNMWRQSNIIWRRHWIKRKNKYRHEGTLS